MKLEVAWMAAICAMSGCTEQGGAPLVSDGANSDTATDSAADALFDASFDTTPDSTLVLDAQAESSPSDTAVNDSADAGSGGDVASDGSCERAYATTCSAPCMPVHANQYDSSRACMKPTETVACALDVADADASYKCRVLVATGQIYFFPVYAPDASGPWRACTTAEAAKVPASPC